MHAKWSEVECADLRGVAFRAGPFIHSHRREGR